MAGPSIVVRILGDAKALGAAFTASSKTAESAAARMHGAFSSVLGTLNQSGVLGPFGDSLASVDAAMGKIAEHGRTIGTVMLGVGGAVAGVGLGLQALGSKDQAAHQQLQAAVAATGASYDDYSKRVEEAIKHQERFGDTANQTQDALRVLTQATHDPTKALDLLSTATNVAAAKHEDLTSAATQLGRVYNGNTKLLKEYGIVVDKHTHLTAAGQTATEALAKVTAGQASAAADTFSGKIKALTTSVEDSAASFGQKYGPAITAAGAATTLLGGLTETAGAVMSTFRTTTEVATAATAAQTVATEAQSVALEGEAAAAVTADAASLPLIATVGLIVLAVAALGAVAYVVYRNWNTIWTNMKRIVVDVWDWIKNNWPLLLAILLGPFAVAVLEITRHWDGFVGFFTALPGRIASVAAHMWDSIVGAFRTVLNAIIDLWNQLHFTLPKVDILGVHIGGETIGVPHIPHLAQGGLITQSGLVYAHAGEAITPAPASALRGPAVNMEHVTFSTEVDVESFMRKTAWMIQTQRI
jgi:hypothetical protein